MAATTLKIGSKGESVKSLQKKLGIKADGIFGKQTDAAVKAYQAKNKLVSDGIVGAKTSAKLGGGGSSSNMSKPTTTKSTVNQSYVNTNMSRPGSTNTTFRPFIDVSSNKSSIDKKNLLGSAFGSISSADEGDSLNLSENNVIQDIANTYKDNPIIKSNIKTIQDINSSFSGDTKVKEPTTTISGVNKSYTTAPIDPNANMTNASTGLPDNSLNYIDTPTTPVPTVIKDEINTGGSTKEPDTLTDPLGYEALTTGTPTGNNNTLAQWGSLMNTPMGTTDNTSAKTWGDDLVNDKFTGQNIVKIKQIADLYGGDMNRALADFNTPQGQEYLNTLAKDGIKKEDILAKIQPVKNGILEPQNWQQFNEILNNLDEQARVSVDEYVNSKMTGQTDPTLLSTNVPNELKAFVDSANNMAILESQYINQKEKDLWTNNYNDKVAAIEEVRINEQLINSRVDALEEKTNYYAKKYKAEMKSQEAEVEMSRITAKKNLTEFLAKIGALRTDGNAQLGIETLDQQYQAQKSAIRTKYSSMIDEMEWEANEKINDLNFGLQKDRLTLMRDLNKSERDTRADLLDLEFNKRKSVLETQGKLNDKLQDLREKQKSDTKDNEEKWLRSFFDLSGWNQFAGMDEEYQNTWIENALKGKSDKNSWINQLKPGSISKSNVDKSAEDFYGGSTTNNNDPLGVL